MLPDLTSTLTLSPASSIEWAIAAWHDAKSKRSSSHETSSAYRDTLADFRALLRTINLDLNSDARAIALTAQAFAGSSKRSRDISASTYNQRLAILSSFYTFARKSGLLDLDNPISRIERRAAHAYQSAIPLTTVEVAQRLKAIDRSTLSGKRDYALLVIALHTGRRVTELASLHWTDLVFAADKVTVTFQRTKGGKTASDTLSAPASRALFDYLNAIHGAELVNLSAETPVWLSFSRQNKGKAIGGQTIADICHKHLGTSKVHTLRHTFAHSMERSGAPVSEIQARLGHESLATTGRYLAALKRAENPYADELSRLFGLD